MTVRAKKYQMFNDYFKGLSKDILVREVWHTHQKKHYGKEIGMEWLPQRAADYLNIIDIINPRWTKIETYSPRWLPIPNEVEVIQNYAKVFYGFNCFISLNYYEKMYGVKMGEVFKATHHLKRMKAMSKTFTSAQVKEQESFIVELKRQLPTKSFVDLAFDFDVGEDIEMKTIVDAIENVLKLIRWLEKSNTSYELYFSGSKGFHVVVPYGVFGQTMAENNHRINEHLVSMIEHEIGRLFIDRSIYSSRRQLRMVNTKHAKSGLYKIPITKYDLKKGEDYIKEKARMKQPLISIEHEKSNQLNEMYAHASEIVSVESNKPVKPKEVAILKRTLGQDISIKKSHNILQKIDRLNHPACISQALKHGIIDITKSNRNQVTLLLANYFKMIGRGIDEIKEYLSNHAATILAPFSSSSIPEIKGSAKGTVQTVFHNDKYYFTCSRAKSLGFDCDYDCVFHEMYGRTQMDRSLTTVPYVKSDDKPKPGTFETVEEVRKAVFEKISQYIENCENNPSKQVSPLLIKAPPGSGKTTQAYHFMGKTDKRSLMVSPQYRLYNNIPKSYIHNWKRIMGRHNGVTVEGESTPVPANCIKHKITQKFGKKNYNVFTKVCKQCDAFRWKTCNYLNQFKDREHNWFIQQPSFIHKARDIIPKFDYVFMDESILSSYIDTKKITVSHIHEVKDFMENLMDYWDCHEDDDEFRQAEYLVAFLSVFLKILNDKILPSVLSGELLYQHLNIRYTSMFLVDDGYPESFEKLISEIDLNWRDALNKKTLFDENIDDNKLPPNFLPELFHVLSEEIHFTHLKDVPARLYLKIDEGQRKLFLTMKYNPPPLSRPMVVLDATAKQVVYEKILNHSVDIFEPKLRYENPIIQLYSVFAGVTSLSTSKSQMKGMLEGLKILLKKESNTLIICKKRFEKRIKKMGIPKETQIARFYGSRGSNDYQAAKQVVIFGAPGWDKETILAYAAALYPGEKLSTKQWFPLRQYHGTNKAIRVREYVDKRVQMIYEMSVIDEIIQSLNRIRPLIYGDKIIYIMTNVVIPDLPISKLMSLSELRGIVRKKPVSDKIYSYLKRKIQKDGFATYKEIKNLHQDVSRPGIMKIVKAYLTEMDNIGLEKFRITRKGNVTTNQVIINTTIPMKKLKENIKNNLPKNVIKIEQIKE